jgi:hypothetical protein
MLPSVSMPLLTEVPARESLLLTIYSSSSISEGAVAIPPEMELEDLVLVKAKVPSRLRPTLARKLTMQVMGDFSLKVVLTAVD